MSEDAGQTSQSPEVEHLFEQFQLKNSTKKPQHIRFGSSGAAESSTNVEPKDNDTQSTVTLLKAQIANLQVENEELRRRLTKFEDISAVKVLIPSNIQLNQSQKELVRSWEDRIGDELSVEQMSQPKINIMDLFKIDKSPSVMPKREEVDEDNSEANIPESPSIHIEYECFAGGQMTVDMSTEQPKANSARPVRNPMVCFNCSGHHRIDKCPEPKDYARIAKNKSAQRRQAVPEKSRYHEQDSNSSKRFRPGRIGNELCDALEIDHYELPEWIYRMRHLGPIQGYPPGYLKQATITSQPKQVLKFHNQKDDTDDNEQVEEEIPEEAPCVEKQKIFYYHGFNIPASRSTRDRDRHYRCPSFDEFVSIINQNLKEMHEQNLRQVIKVKRPLSEPKKPQVKKRREEDIEMVDMEVSDDDQVERQSVACSSNDGFSIPTPSIPPWDMNDGLDKYSEDQLKKLHNKIKVQLDENGPGSPEEPSAPGVDAIAADPVTIPLNCDDDSIEILDSTDSKPNGTHVISKEEILSDHFLAETRTAELSLVGQTRLIRYGSSRSLEMAMGTPALTRIASTSKPDVAAFGKGVQPFENRDEPPPGKKGSFRRIQELIGRLKGGKNNSDQPASTSQEEPQEKKKKSSRIQNTFRRSGKR